MTRGRLAVTGVGMVTALGESAPSTFARLVRGERAFSDVTLFDTEGQRTTLAAEVCGFRPRDVALRGEAPHLSRSDALALVAATEALSSSGSVAGGALGIAVGVTTGGMLEAEELLRARGVALPPGEAAARLLSYPLSSTAARLAERTGARGPVATVCSACSSGANAFVQAAAWLRLGIVPRVLVGGTDALSRITFTGFNALGATDLVPCRPFDRRRAGLTLGEGAAFVVLETEEEAVSRGAPVLAWLSGWSVAAEAHHITQPEPSGRVPAQAISAAIRHARLSPEDIDYVNAHGTGTVSNDAVETLAIVAALGREAERMLVSSQKGQIGHTLGAAGAIEAAVTVLALAHQEVPPTGGLTEPDDACRLNHVLSVGRKADVRAALSSSFGFGGTCTVLLFERAAATARPRAPEGDARITITGLATIGGRGVVAGPACAADARAGTGAATTRLPVSAQDLVLPARSRRFDAQACLATAGARAALVDAGLAPWDRGAGPAVGLVVGTAFGNVERTVAFIRAAAEKGPRRVPPAEFPHLLPSSASGNASIYLALSGPVLSTCDLDATAEAALSLGCDWLEAGFSPCIVAGSAHPHDAFAEDVLGPLCEAQSGYPRSEGAAWVVLEPLSVARSRGASQRVLVSHRYQAPVKALGELRFARPVRPDSAVVVSSRRPEALAPVLSVSGWGSVPLRLTAPVTGFHEGATGQSLCAAAALVLAGEATEALVIGWNASRVFAFHLSRDE